MATSENSAETNLSRLISSAEAIPASRSRRPESVAASPTRGIFGPSSRDYFAYFDRDSSYWKTSQGTFLLGLEPFSETWPDSGTMRNGRAYELQTSAPATSASGCSLWPTADACVMNDGETPETFEARREKNLEKHCNGNGMGTPLAMKVQMWPTARQEDGESCGNHPGVMDSLTGATKTWATPNTPSGGPNTKSTLTHTGGLDLDGQVLLWKTPHGMGNEDFRGKKGGAGGGEFALQCNQWRTPNTRDHHQQGPRADAKQRQITLCDQAIWQMPTTDSFRSRGGDRKDEMGLDQQARFWPTSSARDWKSGQASQATMSRNARPLNEIAEHHCLSLPDPQTPDGPPSCESGPTSRRHSASEKKTDSASSTVSQPVPRLLRRRLNPRFVEWLMGFPIGWTEL